MNTLRTRLVLLFAFLLISMILFRAALTDLVALSWGDERYTQLILIPALSVALIYLDRRQVFGAPGSSPGIGIPLLASGVFLYYIPAARALGPQYRLSEEIFCVVVIWTAGLFLTFGSRAVRAAAFPVAFLLLMIPLPATLLGTMVAGLQEGSANASGMLFRLIGVPNYREDLYFLLPGVQIKIAEQCSGIRSSQALLLVSVLAGHIFLRSGWRTMLTALLTLPLTIFKNAVRIVSLSTLAVYVNQDFLHGNLHHYGGLVFSLLDLLIVIPFIYLRPGPRVRPLES